MTLSSFIPKSFPIHTYKTNLYKYIYAFNCYPFLPQSLLLWSLCHNPMGYFTYSRQNLQEFYTPHHFSLSLSLPHIFLLFYYQRKLFICRILYSNIVEMLIQTVTGSQLYCSSLISRINVLREFFLLNSNFRSRPYRFHLFELFNLKLSFQYASSSTWFSPRQMVPLTGS